MDLRDFQLEQPTKEALVGAADEDLRAANRPTDLQHECLDVLTDAVVLQGALLRRGQDRLHALADIEDQGARLHPVDGARDELAFAVRELVKDLVALDFADALEDDLLGGLGADPTKDVTVQLLRLHGVAGLRVGVVDDGIRNGDLGQFVLDLLDDQPRPEDPDPTTFAVDADLDVLVACNAAVGGLDPVLHRPDQLLPGDLLLRVELEEGANEVSTHDRHLHTARYAVSPALTGPKKDAGVTHVTERPIS